MKIIKCNKTIHEILSRESTEKIGFVPTMGALHRGHLSLIDRAKQENDIVVASIFVNPLQFNNKSDLDNYPISLEEDIFALKKHGCDYLYLPISEDIFPPNENHHNIDIDLAGLDSVMEGIFRPSHFKGVAIVVKRLFEIMTPENAYFGEKDFQQVAIIKQMVSSIKIPVNIIVCDTIREKNGLAMSSRNRRLSNKEKELASVIYKNLNFVKNKYPSSSINYLKKEVENVFEKSTDMKLEYFEIADATTLQPVINKKKHASVVACIAVYINNVRLIDNISFRI